MLSDTIERDFQTKVSRKVRLETEGINRYRVLTPFRFDDGDHLAIVLKKEETGWVLSDEAHTYMHLTYDIDEKALHSGTRQKLISNVLSVFQVEDRSGELILNVANERYGDAFYTFVQALLKITDVSYLSRERVKSTFDEDFRALVTSSVPEDRRRFDWHDPKHDPNGKYTVDCYINGQQRPLYVYALTTDGQARDATISLHQFEKWGIPSRSLAIFEDQESINRKVLARFSDICEKQFSNLSGNRKRIQNYLGQVIAA